MPINDREIQAIESIFESLRSARIKFRSLDEVEQARVRGYLGTRWSQTYRRDVTRLSLLLALEKLFGPEDETLA